MPMTASYLRKITLMEKHDKVLKFYKLGNSVQANTIYLSGDKHKVRIVSNVI